MIFVCLALKTGSEIRIFEAVPSFGSYFLHSQRFRNLFQVRVLSNGMFILLS